MKHYHLNRASFILYSLLFLLASFSPQSTLAIDRHRETFDYYKTYTPAIEYVQEKKWMNGYQQHEYTVFLPERFITRAEFLRVLIDSTYSTDSTGTCVMNEERFPDVKKTDWFYPHVCMATKNHLIPTTLSLFDPLRPVELVDGAIMYYALQGNTLDISDTQIPDKAMEFLSRKKIIPPTITTTRQLLRRDETAQLFYSHKEHKRNTYTRFIKKGSEYKEQLMIYEEDKGYNLEFAYAIIDNRVTHLGKKIQYADPYTFENMDIYGGEHYAKDKNHVYLGTKILPHFDAPSFNDFENYLYDKNTVLCRNVPLEGADGATFSALSNAYLPSIWNDVKKDKNHLYFDCKQLPGSDSESFEILSEHYAKDKNQGYFMERDTASIIHPFPIDSDSFRVIGEVSNIFSYKVDYFARDKDHYYSHDTRINPSSDLYTRAQLVEKIYNK